MTYLLQEGGLRQVAHDVILAVGESPLDHGEWRAQPVEPRVNVLHRITHHADVDGILHAVPATERWEWNA